MIGYQDRILGVFISISCRSINRRMVFLLVDMQRSFFLVLPRIGLRSCSTSRDWLRPLPTSHTKTPSCQPAKMTSIQFRVHKLHVVSALPSKKSFSRCPGFSPLSSQLERLAVRVPHECI